MVPKEYSILFNAITDTIETLKSAQQRAEEAIMDQEESGEEEEPPA